MDIHFSGASLDKRFNRATGGLFRLKNFVYKRSQAPHETQSTVFPYPSTTVQSICKVEAWDYDPTSSLSGGYVSFSFEVHVNPVNDPPSIVGPEGGVFVGMEDFKVHLSAGGGIVLSDPDELEPDGDFMEVKVTVELGSLRLPLSYASGLYLLNGEQPRGSPEFWARGGLVGLNHALKGLIYLPPADWSGVDHVNVWVGDHDDRGGDKPSEALGSYAITVQALPDAPKVHFPRIVHYLDEDTLLVIDFITVSDADPDSILTVEAQPDYGGIEVMQTGSQEEVWRKVEVHHNSSSDVKGNEHGGLTLRGTSQDVNEAIQSLAYRPPTDFAGQVALSVRATDETGLTADGETYLFVRPINDPPMIYLQGKSGGTLQLKMTAGGTGDAIEGIVITDVDVADSSELCNNFQGVQGINALSLRFSPEFGSVSIVAEHAVGVRVVGEPTAGPGESLLLQGSMQLLQTAINEGLVLYSTSADFTGIDTIELAVSDGGNCGGGGMGSVSRTVVVEVAPYEPPLTVTFGANASADSPLFTREGGLIELPNVVVTGGSVGEREAVEVVILAISGNVTLRQANLDDIEVLRSNMTAGEHLRLRGSPAALTAALVGMSFEPRPYFFGCWDRNNSFADDTPVRSFLEQGPLALARVHVVGAPDGAGGDISWEPSNPRPNTIGSTVFMRVSVGWLNDPPTINAPERIGVASTSLESPVLGVHVADPDVMDAPEERGRLEVNVSTTMKSVLAVDTFVALKNGLRNVGVDEHQIRLRGRPEYINNVLETLTILPRNATNGTEFNSGDRVDDILIAVSDLGFTGDGGERISTASIVVEAELSIESTFEHDVFALERILPLVSTREDESVAVPGLESVLSGAGEREQSTVIVSAKEGYLSLGPHSSGVAEAAAKKDWRTANTVVETIGGAVQTLPEIQVRS